MSVVCWLFSPPLLFGLTYHIYWMDHEVDTVLVRTNWQMSIERNSKKSGTCICVLLWKNCIYFCDPLSFHLLPLSRQNLHLSKTWLTGLQGATILVTHASKNRRSVTKNFSLVAPVCLTFSWLVYVCTQHPKLTIKGSPHEKHSLFIACSVKLLLMLTEHSYTCSFTLKAFHWLNASWLLFWRRLVTRFTVCSVAWIPTAINPQKRVFRAKQWSFSAFASSESILNIFISSVKVMDQDRAII